MGRPLVSVIIATYNGAEYLTEQLKTITGQTYPHLEIIICDDGSTDGTKDIIKQFAEKDKRAAFYFNDSNKGVNENFAEGFRKATGEFIAIADQDDIWLPEKIEEQLAMFGNDNIILAYSSSLRFSGKQLPEKKALTGSNLFEGNDVRKLLLRNSVSGHNMMFRKKLLDHIFPIPRDVYYDWWIVQAAACTGIVAASSRVLAYHRQHESNVTSQHRVTKLQTDKEYRERKMALAAFLQLKGLQENDRAFIKTLRQKFLLLENSTFSGELFNFMMTNRKILFYYKKGLFAFFSQRKAAKRMSSRVNL